MKKCQMFLKTLFWYFFTEYHLISHLLTSKYKCHASLTVCQFNIQYQYIIKRKSYDLTDKMITRGKICSDPLSDCLSYSVRPEIIFIWVLGLKVSMKGSVRSLTDLPINDP